MNAKRFQLGLIHAAVAITLVPINSTLNRVMIKELAISAALVAILASLPFLFSPLQVAIGSFSDRYPLFGWRRTPYIFLGLLLCAAGLAMLPQVAFLIVENRSAGIGLSILAFGAWGMGYNFATVSYFSLASEISGEAGRSKTIAVMFTMMIVSIILSAATIGWLLQPYSPELLIRVFQWIAAVALIMGLIGLFRLEHREKRAASHRASDNTSWSTIARTLMGNRQAQLFFFYLILLLTAILGQDILLEPFGAEAFNLPVNVTTRITSIWGTCFLVALIVGSRLEKRWNKFRVAKIGAWSGVVAFGLILVSGLVISVQVFYSGVVLLGVATGLSTVSNLSLMLDMTTVGSVGLFIGAWGMASAIARLAGNVLSGVIRDTVTMIAQTPVAGYLVVFGLELGMLLLSLWLLQNVDVSLFQREAVEAPSIAERVALAGDLS